MKKRLSALGLVLLLSACGQVESEAQVQLEVPKVAASKVEPSKIADAQADIVSIQERAPITCEGVLEQGGAVLCYTLPNASVRIGGLTTKSDQNGQVILGFDRDAAAQEVVQVVSDDGKTISHTFEIAPRKFGVQRIDGLPPSQVSSFSEKQLVHIRASSARKKKGFASRQTTMGFRDGFVLPVDGTKTSDFGNQRILNGVPKRPHYGVDIAAPVGTPIYAPADGVISLADDDLYFEGAMVLLDHGQGLISMYLHMSDIIVEPGQSVKRGDKIGAVGAKGRATGPHLCWRLKWRNRNLDPELLTRWPHE